MTEEIRVLVVDDDAGARALHSRFVTETPGFVLVGTAATGESALVQSRRGVDLLLLDMRLPDISGVEVLHRLRTVGRGGPDALVISSSSDQVTVRQASAAHIVGYLVKPFTQEVLREIDRLLATGGIRVGTHARPSPSGVTGARPPDAPRERTPKGIADVTLARVLDALDPAVPRSVSDVAELCEISRATARRYLDHLVRIGAIDLAHRYGRRGRPQVLYRLAPAPER